MRCRVIWSVSLSDNVCPCVFSFSAFRMAAHGKGRGGSVLFVVMVLGCFSSGVEGGECSYRHRNVKAENMGACNTCEASCATCTKTAAENGCGACTYNHCENGCGHFFGTRPGYPTLSSCKAFCVSPPMNRPRQCNPAVWCRVRAANSCSLLTHTRPASVGVPL